MNFFNGIINDKGELKFANNQRVKLKKSDLDKLMDFTGEKRIVFGIRPEDAHYILEKDKDKFDGVLKARVEVKENLGSETLLYCNLDLASEKKVFDAQHGFKLIAKVLSREAPNDNLIDFGFKISDIHLFDKETGVSLFKDIESGLYVVKRSKG